MKVIKNNKKSQAEEVLSDSTMVKQHKASLMISCIDDIYDLFDKPLLA
jgi:hypothetical protein